MLGALQTKRLHPLGLPGSAAQLQNNQICCDWLGAAHGWGYLEFSRAGRLELLPYLKQEKVITPPAGTCQWLQARILNQTRTVRHCQVEAAKNTSVMSEIIPRDEQSSSRTPAAPLSPPPHLPPRSCFPFIHWEGRVGVCFQPNTSASAHTASGSWQ